MRPQYILFYSPMNLLENKNRCNLQKDWQKINHTNLVQTRNRDPLKVTNRCSTPLFTFLNDISKRTFSESDADFKENGGRIKLTVV